MWIPKWLKNIVVKSLIGVVEDKVAEYVTVANITNLITTAANAGIEKASKNLSDERVGKICDGCSTAGNALRQLADALNPSGPEGRTISTEEAQIIMAGIQSACGVVITQEWLDERRKALLADIKEKLGVPA